jgi:hypothetical protein
MGANGESLLDLEVRNKTDACSSLINGVAMFNTFSASH